MTTIAAPTTAPPTTALPATAPPTTALPTTAPRRRPPTTAADLGHLGLGRRPLDPISPPPTWAQLPTSAHSLLKASRAVLLVEHLATRLGLPVREVERLRPVLYVMASAVYDWDAAVEDASGGADEHGPQERLRTIVMEVAGSGVVGPTDLDGLDRLARAERAALAGELAVRDAFLEVCRWRSCDLRLMLWTIAVLHGWSPSLVDAVAPLLELFEVDDDLSSVADDARRGSYNSWLVLRRQLPADQAAAFLDEWAGERAVTLVRALDALPPQDAARVEALLLLPPVPGRALGLGLVRSSPRWVRRLVHRVVVARLAGFFHGRTPADEVVAQAGARG